MKTLKLLFVLSAFLLSTSQGAFAQTNFPDVPSTEMYASGIQFLKDQGIVHGYPDGRYRPANSINRAEMMKVIIEGYAEFTNQDTSFLTQYADDKCFDDVPRNEWYTKYVCYGKATGIVVGFDNGQFFRPAQMVTFVEALKITMEVLDIEYETSTPWYRDLVVTASESNYIPHSISAFQGQLKRNQMADMIARMLKDDTDQLPQYLGDRVNVRATYETILAGRDLSKLRKIKFNLNEQNDSNQSGRGFIYETVDNKLLVKIRTAGGPAAPAQPAHIHFGVCSNIGAIKYSLTDVLSNTSDTTLAVTMNALINDMKTSNFALNIHKSAAESTVYYACGDIPETTSTFAIEGDEEL